MNQKTFSLFALSFFSTLAGSAGPAPMFPFVISYDAPDNAVNFSHLVDKPAGAKGRVRVEGGHFVNDAGRIRFNATNLTGPGNFPTHQEADKLAARLARFGFNCVRLHYMDDDYGNFKEEKQHGIIANDPKTKRDLDPVQLDKLDYLIAALKRNGIYVDINLHVARDFDERDGFTGGHPWADKGLDNFEPRMIALQKEYAKKLLTHVNPYTKLPYTQDPCVAMVEINNENSMKASYTWGAFDSLGSVYSAELRKQWNVWLAKKYSTTEALVTAWQFKAVPLGNEQIPEGRFDTPVAIEGKTWVFQKGKAKAATGVSSNGTLRVEVKASDDKFPKLFRTVSVKQGEPYTVSFRIRKVSGNVPAQIGFAVADDKNGGWNSVGVFEVLKGIGKKWTTVKRSFYALDTSAKAQVQLTRFTPGEFEMDDLSFQSGATVSFPLESAKIEEGAMPFPKKGQLLPKRALDDVMTFIHDTEMAYWTGMCEYLHKELRVLAPVSGTQVSYSFPDVQTALDYCDEHSYWCHPSPVAKDWLICNDCMVNSLACVNGLERIRKSVAGKPYTVSEYNHPYPIFYGAEGQPFLRSYGAAFAWDGVFEYTYNHRSFFEPDHNTYFFSIIARTDVLAHMPACAAIFLRGDVSEIQETNLWSVMKGNIFQTANGQLTWNKEIKGKAYFTVDTPNTKLFTGFPEGRAITMGDVTLAVGKTRLDWATVSLTSRKATGFTAPGSILLAATGLSHNNGAVFTKHDNGNKKFSSRDADWGKGPVMNEGIPALITLPSSAGKTTCFALDPRGGRKARVPVTIDNCGRAVLGIGPQYQTVWYEIVLQ